MSTLPVFPTIEPQWLKCSLCGDRIDLPGAEEWPETDYDLQPWQRVRPLPEPFVPVSMRDIAGANRFVPKYVLEWLDKHTGCLKAKA